MYRKQVRRRRGVLVLLVVACLMLISISISEAEDGPLHSVQNGVSSILNPIGEGASRALKPGRDLINWFSETLDARGENDDLKKQVAELRDELTAQQDAAEKAGYADQLGELMQDSELDAYEPVDALVTYRPSSAWYARIKIDKGSDDGIAKDDGVVTDQGLIGRVDQLGGGWADVVLLTDGTNSVTARVSGKGPVGSVEPVVGAPGELDFSLVEGGGGFEQGDELVTASFQLAEGVGSRLPPNIPIGEIDQDVPEESDIQDEIKVDPFADFDDLNEVTVLTGGPE
jgi:rod shape-determining protein MreC